MIGDYLGVKWWQMPLNDFDKTSCAKIAFLSKVEEKYLYSKSYHSLLKELDNYQCKIWFLRSGAKYCPMCLAEKKLHKFVWGFKPINVCTKHSTVLIHSCQCCKRKIQINSLIHGKCQFCGFALEQAEAISIEEEDILLLAQHNFQELLIGNKSEGFGKLSGTKIIILFDAFFRLFKGFESLLEPKDKFKEKKIFLDVNDDMEYAISFANVYWMLFIDFPQNFIKALEVFDKSNSPRKKYRKKQFTNFLSYYDEFSFVKNALEMFKEIQIRNGKMPRNLETFDAASAAKLKQLYYTKRDISKLFDLTRDEVDKMCEKGILTPKQVRKEGHINYYFDKRQTEKVITNYLNERSDLITKKEAAKILGVSVETITDLIEKKIIMQKQCDLSNQCFYLSKKSLGSLMETLGEKAVLVSEKELSHFVIFEKCLHKYVTCGLSISKLLQWAISQKISFYTVTEDIKINKLYFDENEIKKYLHFDDIENNGYNLRDVSKILGFSERTLHKIINAKLITPIKVNKRKNGSCVYFFDKHQIEKFKDEYITSVEASVKYRVKYSTLNNYAHRKILVNYMSGICQKTLFNKKELEEFLHKRCLINDSTDENSNI
jgi:TniQ